MNLLYNCCRCRLFFMAAALVSWIVSLAADGAALAGWAGDGSGTVAYYGIIAGVFFMACAAAISMYDLQLHTDPAAAKAELIDAAVVVAAVLFFLVNAFIRSRSGPGTLPMVLSAVGIAGVLAEFWLDIDDVQSLFKQRRLS